MEKCNVVEDKRTPKDELNRPDENWDKHAAAEFTIKEIPMPVMPVIPKIDPDVAHKLAKGV